MSEFDDLYNIILTLNRTSFDTQSQVVVLSVKGIMYPGDPAQNLVLPLGPDPTIMTFYDIVIGGLSENPGLIVLNSDPLVPGDEFDVVALDSSTFGLTGRWRIRADVMAYNGFQSVEEINNIVVKVTRVVA
jgi:hypothetical protein